MKERVDKLEDDIVGMKVILTPLKEKVDRLHDKKGEDNGKLQTFQAMLDMFEKNQDAFAKRFREEQDKFTEVFRTEMKTISATIAKITNWKSMIIGAWIVLGGLGTCVIIGLQVFMSYHK